MLLDRATQTGENVHERGKEVGDLGTDGLVKRFNLFGDATLDQVPDHVRGVTVVDITERITVLLVDRSAKCLRQTVLLARYPRPLAAPT